MAYLNLYSRVTIGEVVFKNINGFEISESVTEISDKATITLARNYMQLIGKPVTDYIKAGDPVKIEAGYNGNLYVEYEGYVSEAPTADIPLIVKCDELYPLRQGNIVKSYKSVTLKQLLQETIKGYTIECPDVVLGKMLIDNVSPYQMLESLKKNFGFYTKLYSNTILHVGWAFDWQPNYTTRHKYTFAENVKSADSLKFKHKDDFNTRIKITIVKPDGTKETVEVGSKNKDAAQSQLTLVNKTQAEAKEIGQARLLKVSYDGFEGSVKGFGIPRVHSGDSLEFLSKKHPERNGAYLAEKVTIKYDENGFERTTKIGFKL